jgi:cold shock protein
MATGTVRFFNFNKGFGVISPDGSGHDVFVQTTTAENACLRILTEGQRVSFDVQLNGKGSKAVNLRVA